jgi:predicted proteasome-type protease
MINKSSKLRDLIKKMIAESKISERISHIEEAGNIAANEAKLTRIGEELKKASKIAEVLEKVNLEHYIGEKLYSKVKEEMAKSIQEYEDAKMQLEEKKSSKETSMKDVKDDKKGKEKVLESKSKKLND